VHDRNHPKQTTKAKIGWKCKKVLSVVYNYTTLF